MNTVGQDKTELELPSQFEVIERVAKVAAEFAARCGVGEMELFGIDLAIREAVANAVKHGNREDAAKKVRVSFENIDNALVIKVADEGAGFDYENLPDPTDAENILKTSGRGIFLIRNFMDEVEWQRPAGGGTTLIMTKKI